MHSPVRSQTFVGMRNVWVDKQSLSFGNDRFLPINDEFLPVPLRSRTTEKQEIRAAVARVPADGSLRAVRGGAGDIRILWNDVEGKA